MPDDVLGDDHRIVDHESDCDRQCAERHEIEGLTEQRHQPDGDRERERYDGRADSRDAPIAQEHEQNHHR